MAHAAITEVESEGMLAAGELMGHQGGLLVGIGPCIFLHGQIHLRQCFSAWADHVVAAELFVQLNGGDVPFQMRAKLGGERRMRGYFSGRYRDLHQVVGQLEYRAPIWGRFGGVGFVGAGNVARKLAKFRFDEPKVAGGLGLRFALSPNERVNIRADVAMTADGNSNLYISLAEAF